MKRTHSFLVGAAATIVAVAPLQTAQAQEVSPFIEQEQVTAWLDVLSDNQTTAVAKINAFSVELTPMDASLAASIAAIPTDVHAGYLDKVVSYLLHHDGRTLTTNAWLSFVRETTAMYHDMTMPTDIDFSIPEDAEYAMDASLVNVLEPALHATLYGAHVTLTGDAMNNGSVTHVTVKDDGVYVTVDGLADMETKVLDNTSGLLDDVLSKRFMFMNADGVLQPMHFSRTADGTGLRTHSPQKGSIYIVDAHTRAFTDVSAQHWFYDDVMHVAKYGYMNGTTDTTFAPNDSITRGQVAGVLARYLDKDTALAIHDTDAFFRDVEGRWYATAVNMLTYDGVFTERVDEHFYGQQRMMRADVAVAVVNALRLMGVDVTADISQLQFQDTLNLTGTEQEAVAFLVKHGILLHGADRWFYPHKDITRAQFAKIVHQAFDLVK